MKQDCYGLSYKPDAKERSKIMKSRRENRRASLKGTIVEGEPMEFPHLRETFYSIRIEHDDIRPSQTTIMESFEKLTINVIEGIEVKGEDARAMVHPMSPGDTPKNYTTTKIPTIFLLLQ